jgi:hypothetical protein
VTKVTALLLVGLAGCAAPPPAPDPVPYVFDAAAWLVRARSFADNVDGGRLDVYETEETRAADVESRAVAAKALSAELDAAVGWSRVCDTYWDPAAGREVTEPTEPGGGHEFRGTYGIDNAGPDADLVLVACEMGAHGTYVLVHVVGGRAALLVAPHMDEAGAPYGPPSARYSNPSVTRGEPRFTTFARARGHYDCGVYSRYRITGLGTADLGEVRSRACDDNPNAALQPWEWPVVYPRP